MKMVIAIGEFDSKCCTVMQCNQLNEEDIDVTQMHAVQQREKAFPKSQVESQAGDFLRGLSYRLQDYDEYFLR